MNPNRYDSPINWSSLVDGGNTNITVYLKDKTTEELTMQVIKKAQLAKAFQPTSETPVVGAFNGKFVIEV